MEKIRVWWDGLTSGAQFTVLSAVFALFIGAGLLRAELTGQFNTAPVVVASSQEVALNKARNSAMNDAMDLCEAAVSRAATNRSSVKFLGISDGQRIRQDGAGRFMVTTRFSAKNGFGSESVNIARCVISDDGRTMLDMTTQDSR